MKRIIDEKVSVSKSFCFISAKKELEKLDCFEIKEITVNVFMFQELETTQVSTLRIRRRTQRVNGV